MTEENGKVFINFQKLNCLSCDLSFSLWRLWSILYSSIKLSNVWYEVRILSAELTASIFRVEFCLKSKMFLNIWKAHSTRSSTEARGWVEFQLVKDRHPHSADMFIAKHWKETLLCKTRTKWLKKYLIWKNVTENITRKRPLSSLALRMRMYRVTLGHCFSNFFLMYRCHNTAPFIVRF
jgi:hypothetical protein